MMNFNKHMLALNISLVHEDEIHTTNDVTDKTFLCRRTVVSAPENNNSCVTVAHTDRTINELDYSNSNGDNNNNASTSYTDYHTDYRADSICNKQIDEGDIT